MPDNAEAWFHLGDDAMEHKEYSNAISHYNQGLNRSSKDPKALNNLGTAYLFTGNLQEALKYYDAALRAYPEYNLASRNRAFVQHLLAANPPASK